MSYKVHHKFGDLLENSNLQGGILVVNIFCSIIEVNRNVLMKHVL